MQNVYYKCSNSLLLAFISFQNDNKESCNTGSYYHFVTENKNEKSDEIESVSPILDINQKSKPIFFFLQ